MLKFTGHLAIEFQAESIQDARIKLKEFSIALKHGYSDIKNISVSKEDNLFETGDLI